MVGCYVEKDASGDNFTIEVRLNDTDTTKDIAF